MPSTSNLAKIAITAIATAGGVALFSGIQGGDVDELRVQAADLLRATAKGARWLADKAEMTADFLEPQGGEEYAAQQWEKVELAQQRAGL